MPPAVFLGSRGAVAEIGRLRPAADIALGLSTTRNPRPRGEERESMMDAAVDLTERRAVDPCLLHFILSLRSVCGSGLVTGGSH